MASSKWILAIAAVLTLGLAPYTPEPHLFGKIRWVLGGAEGMQSSDYFDLGLHALPWIYLFYLLTISAVNKIKAK